jgi:ParB family chromosome partitioning protein
LFDEAETVYDQADAAAERAAGAKAPIEWLRPGKFQPRRNFDEGAIERLTSSIRSHGILQPIVVRADPAGSAKAGSPRYEIVAGERRWRAAQRAGLHEVPIIVQDLADRDALEIALVENLQRQDLNPLETAQAYRQLIDEHELTQEAVAERVGKNRATVANALRLLHLPAEARDALARGAISEGHARAILAGGTAADRRTLLRAILDRGLSVRQAEELARRLNAGAAESPPDRPPRGVAPDVAALEDRFRRALGTKVQLSRGRRGGKLIVYFFSDDELQGLYDAICGPGE